MQRPVPIHHCTGTFGSSPPAGSVLLWWFMLPAGPRHCFVHCSLVPVGSGRHGSLPAGVRRHPLCDPEHGWGVVVAGVRQGGEAQLFTPSHKVVAPPSSSRLMLLLVLLGCDVGGHVNVLQRGCGLLLCWCSVVRPWGCCSAPFPIGRATAAGSFWVVCVCRGTAASGISVRSLRMHGNQVVCRGPGVGGPSAQQGHCKDTAHPSSLSLCAPLLASAMGDSTNLPAAWGRYCGD